MTLNNLNALYNNVYHKYTRNNNWAAIKTNCLRLPNTKSNNLKRNIYNYKLIYQRWYKVWLKIYHRWCFNLKRIKKIKLKNQWGKSRNINNAGNNYNQYCNCRTNSTNNIKTNFKLQNLHIFKILNNLNASTLLKWTNWNSRYKNKVISLID